MLRNSVRITFSVADLSNIDSEADSTFNERVEFDDEDPSDMDGQSGGANTKGAINQGRTSGGNIKVAPEDSIAPADRPELADEGQGEVGQDGGDEQSFPAHLNVTIFKTASPQKGALQFEVVAQEGGIVIDALHFLPDAALADPSKSEDEWKRSKLYTGPPFSNLDEDLQNLWEAYLEERGVDVRLAEFVPDYIDWKEQKEYLRWLGKLKNLVE